MKNLFSRFRRGFSLLEMIIYITVLVFMLVLIIEVVMSITSSDRVIKAVRNIESAAIVFVERVSREARELDEIDVASSVLGSHPGVLVLDGQDEVGAPRTVEFYLLNGRVMLEENGVVVGALTPSDAYVSNLVFTRFATSTIEGIRTQVTISSGTTTSYRVLNFYSSTLLR
jgi:type II secretory pathway pseudopilin PulG